jgi:hypothetical protein
MVKMANRDFIKPTYTDKQQAEQTAFMQDLDKPLVFDGDNAEMKNYYGREIRISKDTVFMNGDLDLHVDGIHMANIMTDEEQTEYSCYDGVDGYFWYPTPKEAVKKFMDEHFSYPSLGYSTDDEGEPIDDYEEISCRTCGDGGCWHCEPYRFI